MICVILQICYLFNMNNKKYAYKRVPSNQKMILSGIITDKETNQQIRANHTALPMYKRKMQEGKLEITPCILHNFSLSVYTRTNISVKDAKKWPFLKDHPYAQKMHTNVLEILEILKNIKIENIKPCHFLLGPKNQKKPSNSQTVLGGLDEYLQIIYNQYPHMGKTLSKKGYKKLYKHKKTKLNKNYNTYIAKRLTEYYKNVSIDKIKNIINVAAGFAKVDPNDANDLDKYYKDIIIIYPKTGRYSCHINIKMHNTFAICCQDKNHISKEYLADVVSFRKQKQNNLWYIMFIANKNYEVTNGKNILYWNSTIKI